MPGPNCLKNLVAEKPPSKIIIVLLIGFFCTPSIMDIQWLLEKHKRGHSPTCGVILDTINCVQEIFPGLYLYDTKVWV